MEHDPKVCREARAIASKAVQAIEGLQCDLEHASALLNLLATAEEMDRRTADALRAIDMHLHQLAERAGREAATIWPKAVQSSESR